MHPLRPTATTSSSSSSSWKEKECIAVRSIRLCTNLCTKTVHQCALSYAAEDYVHQCTFLHCAAADVRMVCIAPCNNFSPLCTSWVRITNPLDCCSPVLFTVFHCISLYFTVFHCILNNSNKQIRVVRDSCWHKDGPPLCSCSSWSRCVVFTESPLIWFCCVFTHILDQKLLCYVASQKLQFSKQIVQSC